jgi:hypothetical protein
VSRSRGAFFVRVRVLAKRFPRTSQQRREAERRQAHPSMSAPHIRALPREHASGAEARHTLGCCHLKVVRARSPLGAPRRYLPRKSMPRLSLGRASRETRCEGVTFAEIRAYSDAPRAPVIVPAGRCPSRPGAGLRIPPAGTAPAPSVGRHR